MRQDMKAFEAQLRDAFTDVQPSAGLAPEKIGALLPDKKKKNPSVYIVRRVSAMAAAILLVLVGGALLLQTGAVGGTAEAQSVNDQNAVMDVSLFDGFVGADSAPAEAPQASQTAGGTGDTHNAARTDNAKEQDETGEMTDYEALLQAEKQRLEAARTGEEKE